MKGTLSELFLFTPSVKDVPRPLRENTIEPHAKIL